MKSHRRLQALPSTQLIPSAPTSCQTSRYRSDLVPQKVCSFLSRNNFCRFSCSAYLNFVSFLRLQIVKDDLQFVLPGDTTRLHLNLKPDYTVDVLDGGEGLPTGETGNWTIVYDQSIVVELPSRGEKHTANFRYSLKPGVDDD